MNNRLRELRDARGWSQGELAERLEVSRQTINALETGKYDPSLPLAFRTALGFVTGGNPAAIYEGDRQRRGQDEGQVSGAFPDHANGSSRRGCGGANSTATAA